MAKHLTVFYSWQSDTPSKFNRTFIEKAIQEALKQLHSNATLEIALRDTKVELDKDTKGVAGSPPIVDTILGKIENCSVFIADLTFVGESKKELMNKAEQPRLFPNPNVLIEYGYALKCHSHKAVIGVMNDAYGEPNEVTLPFNLRHLRRPVTYSLRDDASELEKAKQFELLARTLAEAVGLILSKHTEQPAVSVLFEPRSSGSVKATYFGDSLEITPEGIYGAQTTSAYKVPTDGICYLRLYPKYSAKPIDNEVDARELARKGLVPMRKFRNSGTWSYNCERNSFGSISYESPNQGYLSNFTQLFLSREIWGIDADSFNASRIKSLTNNTEPFIPAKWTEELFSDVLKSYLKFCFEHLQLSPPLCVKAGIEGIKNYQLHVGNGIPEGRFLKNEMVWEGEISSIDQETSEILKPFFEKLWTGGGFKRPN